MNGSHMFSPFSSAIYHFPPCIFDSVLIYPFSPSEQVLRLMGLIYLSTPRSKCVEWQHRGTKYIFVELDWINRVCAIGREGSCPFKKGLLIIYYFEGQDYREFILQMATMTSPGPDRSYESESSSRSLIWGQHPSFTAFPMPLVGRFSRNTAARRGGGIVMGGWHHALQALSHCRPWGAHLQFQVLISLCKQNL